MIIVSYFKIDIYYYIINFIMYNEYENIKY